MHRSYEFDVTGVLVDGENTVAATKGSKAVIVLDKTPFYATSGGQEGDNGSITTDKGVFVVESTTKNGDGIYLHIGKMESGEISLDQTTNASLSVENRKSAMRNHTAAHLLQSALRQVLGNHVEQAGQLVNSNRLRFDFTHFQAMTAEEIAKAEQMVIEQIAKNITVDTQEMTLDEAKKTGAMALFGEKYGDDVRVIKYGPSVELCGGCHVSSTGKIGSIRIVVETSIAAGVRRIEAVTAAKADELYYAAQDMISGLRALFNNAPDLAGAIKRSIEENAGLKKQIESFMAEKMELLADKLISNAEDYKGIQLVRLQGQIAPDMIRGVMPLLRAKCADKTFALVGATQFEGKPTIAVFLSQGLVDKGNNAGAMIKAAAKLIQGGGGGQPWMATAGGRDVNGLAQAMDYLIETLIV